MTNLSGANLNNGSAVGSQSEGRDSPSNALAAIPKYQAYKDSGVAWLGELPRQWDAIKMKYLYRDTSVKNKASETLLSVTQTQGVVPREWVENRMVMPSGNLASFKFIKKGDFAISLRSFEGGLEYCHHDGIISPAYTVLKAKHSLLCSGYYKYLFKSQAFISELQTSVVGIREGKNISYEELRYSLLPIPKPQEQFSIANFLDQKTAQIDEAIAIKEKQITLLKERKQIIIQKAITQGLDPNVPMKDSGVDWIGKTPVHWRVKRFKHFTEILSGLSPENVSFTDVGVDYFKVDDLNDVDDLNRLAKSKWQVAIKRKLTIYSSGLLLIPKRGGAIGTNKIAITTTDSLFDTNVMGLKFDRRMVDIDFVSIFLKQRNLIDIADTTTIPQINNKHINPLPIALPPLVEQEEIVAHLHDKFNEIVEAINTLRSQISGLKEYKTTLINSAVTGKIKVA